MRNIEENFETFGEILWNDLPISFPQWAACLSTSFVGSRLYFNPLMPGGNKKVTYT